MSKIINVTVANRVATYHRRDGAIVCGNSDYQIRFVFDAEWEEHPTKTARFITGGEPVDVEFTGDTVTAPVLQGIRSVKVGVYAGNLRTTTSALIPCELSILCGGGEPKEPTSSLYAEIMEALNEIRR
jgi:hypothetical protein